MFASFQGIRHPQSLIPRLIGLLLMLGLVNQVQAKHIAALQREAVVYLLYAAPNHLARYDLATDQDLGDLPLAKVPTAFTVKGNLAYIGFNRELKVLDLNTGTEQFIRNFSTSINQLGVAGDFLYVGETGSGSLSVIDTTSLGLVGTIEPFFSPSFIVPSEKNNALYFRDTGVSPADIHKISLSESGLAAAISDSPYHGDYPEASRLFLNTTETKVVDNAGIAYFTADLTYAGSLGGAVEALTFVGDNPVVARGQKLELFNNLFISQGFLPLQQPVQFLGSFEEQVAAFRIDDAGYSVETFDVSSFELPEPQQPADPNEIVYTAEFIESDGADLIYLIDNESQSVFRWSVSQAKYLDSFWLSTPASWVTYSAAHKRLYLAFADGRITYFDSTAAQPREQHFATLPTPPVTGLLAVGDWLFAADYSGAWASHYLFNADGVVADSVEWRNVSSQYVYHPGISRIYHHRDDSTPNDIEWTEFDPVTGQWGQNGDSPYHGDQLAIKTPLRIIDNGNYVLNGAGQILDSGSLALLNALSNPIADAIWIEDQLITVAADSAQLQFWSDKFGLTGSFTIPGALRVTLLEAAGKLVLVKEKAEEVAFILFDPANPLDTDTDGKHDLIDNCPNLANPDQADLDQDSLGNACDSDKDNDQISDDLEVTLGLNPLDAADGDGDLDGDGYSNRIEAILGSILDDEDSLPGALTDYRETFEQGVGLFQIHRGENPWRLSAGGFTGNGLRSADLTNTHISSEVQFSGVFEKSTVTLQVKSLGNYYFLQELAVLVDGQLQSQFGGSSSWRTVSFPLEAGVHTITLRARLPAVLSSPAGNHLIIDDFIVQKDSDQDGIKDAEDNCPTYPNQSQSDYDADGMGDACDPNPTDPTPPADIDGDDVFDVFDNCPEVANASQADVDEDGLGDACDDFDNRPQDTDGDGFLDANDNCPAVVNATQADLDADYMGDACDSDMDGDGLTNTTEDLYEFLDSANPADAQQDFDGDGVRNIYEINNGFNPAVPDEFQSYDLRNYLPLKPGDYAYVDDIRYVTQEVRQLATRDQVVISVSDGMTRRYERRANGIYFVAQSTADDSFGALYEGFLVVPDSLKLGQKITSRVTRGDTGPNATGGDFTVSVELVGLGEKQFDGKKIPSIRLRYEYLFDAGFTLAEETTFLEGIGFYNYGSLLLDSYEFAKPPVVENPNPPGGESKGGALPVGVILLMLMLVAGRVRTRSSAGVV